MSLFEEYGPEGTPDEAAKSVTIGRSIFTIPRDMIPEYIQKLDDLVAEIQDISDEQASEDDSQLYAFTYLMFPVAGT